MNISFSNPKASYLQQKNEIGNAISKVLESGKYILGEEVKHFEKEFAEYNDSKFTIGVANGTDAIFLALKALGIGEGDGIITVSHTAVATISAIRMTGAIPVFLDVSKNDYTLDIEQLESYLESGDYEGHNVKAILPVHLYGHPCEIREITDFAHEYNLKLIEDCAQAHGATQNNRKVSSFGDMGTFSFYPTKNLGAIGDGGAIVCNDVKLYDKLISLREYGWHKRYISEEEGFNSRLDELQASILRVKLNLLENSNHQRFEIANRYLNSIDNPNIKLPSIACNVNHVFHLFVVQVKDQEHFRSYLLRKGINSSIHYPLPVHLQSAFLSNNIIPFNLEYTEHIYKHIVSIPMYPELNNDEVNYIIQSINQYLL